MIQLRVRMIQLRVLRALLGGNGLEKEEGQTLAEYALILALIAVAVVIVVLTLGNTISGIFSNTASSI
jgi:Flp pilus assembly pilin Flp